MFTLKNKTVHNFKQGTDDWLEHRLKCRNASDVPAMLNCHPTRTRNELIRETLGYDKHPLTWYQERLFAEGHEHEAKARPWAEEILETDLLMPTISAEVDGLLLSASYDGLDMMDFSAFEHKMLNKENVEEVESGELSLKYRGQMEQQLLLSGADSVLFMVSNGVKETMRYCFYKTDPELRQRIIDGWHQFEDDLENYVHVPEVVAPVIPDLMELPALDIQLHGGIKSSNLEIYQQSAHEFIENINTELETDEDFAVADKTVKFLKEAEDRIKLVKRQALSQTHDIEEIFNALDSMDSEFASKRKELDKKVKAEKENKKQAICNDATEQLLKYVTQANKLLGDEYIVHKVNFRLAIKSKRTLTSINNTVDSTLAEAKIEVKNLMRIAEKNLNHYNIAATDHLFLFMDLKTLVFKDHETFVLIIKARIDEHKENEETRLAAEREQLEKDLAQKEIDDKNADQIRQDNQEAERAELHNDRMKRKEKDIQEWGSLKKSVSKLVSNVKSGKCSRTQELPLETPKILTIEQTAREIAVKFCRENDLDSTKADKLSSMISSGYKLLSDKESQTA